jgi:hypothetical protein
MKQTPQMKKIHENMRPGILTRDGFLGRDKRNLVDILIDDNARVQRLGLSNETIAQRMKELRDEGAKGLGLSEHVDPHFDILVLGVRGGLPCPFGSCGLIAKVNTTVKNEKNNTSITYTDLSIHLIEEHGFYQGKGSPFRLDPENLTKVIEPEKQKSNPNKVPNLSK